MSGVFISRGMRLAVPAGGLKLGADGAGSLILHVHFDVCPVWLQLAVRHLEDTRTKKSLRLAAWLGSDDAAKASTLEAEFEASMQAIMDAAISIDAFYGVIRDLALVPDIVVAEWRKNRTARYIQVSEVLRRAFNLKKNHLLMLRTNLKEIYRLRDLAVHPSGKIEAPILHPELNVGVEWRFAYFRAENAELVVKAATEILWEFAFNAKPANSEIENYLQGMRPALALICREKAVKANTPSR